MGYCKLPMITNGGGGAKLDNVKVSVTNDTGYLHGRDHSLIINGTLISIGFTQYLGYSFKTGIIYLKDGSTLPLTTTTKNIKDVDKVTYKITSNNSVNGSAVVCITYLPK